MLISSTFLAFSKFTTEVEILEQPFIGRPALVLPKFCSGGLGLSIRLRRLGLAHRIYATCRITLCANNIPSKVAHIGTEVLFSANIIGK